jgi:hypothetical protein
MEYVFREWTDLSAAIISKYNDGYIKNEQGRPEEAGYPKSWQDKVMKNSKGLFLPVWEEGAKTKEPQDY